ncbi:MAG: hypothetical protein LPL29_13360 [Alphaproteobacteria bacterium]|nr:hypothetical protein [Alphaproteobacteria bacterium]
MSDEIPFHQSIPGDMRGWQLVDGGKWDGSLVWQEHATGRKVRVPNIWYNQTVEMRIEAMEHSIASMQENIERTSGDLFLGEQDKLRRINALSRKIKGTRKLIRKMRREGIPLA